MTQKAYFNNDPDMLNAQMNEALVKALDRQLASTAVKNFANHRSTAMVPQTRTHTAGYKLRTNSTLSSSIKNLSLDIDHL